MSLYTFSRVLVRVASRLFSLFGFVSVFWGPKLRVSPGVLASTGYLSWLTDVFAYFSYWIILSLLFWFTESLREAGAPFGFVRSRGCWWLKGVVGWLRPRIVLPACWLREFKPLFENW